LITTHGHEEKIATTLRLMKLVFGHRLQQIELLNEAHRVR
jgi:hypothetical protein